MTFSEKTLKTGFISISTLGESETFIADKLKELTANKYNPLSFIIYSAPKQNNHPLGFLKKHIPLFVKNFVSGKSLKRRLENETKQHRTEFLWIEYGTTAYSILSFLQKSKVPFAVRFFGYDLVNKDLGEKYFNNLPQIFNLAERVVAPSPYVKKLLLNLNCPENKISYEPLKINLESIVPINEIYKNADNIVFAGRLVEKKDPIALISCFSIIHNACPSCTLTVIGDGPLLPEVQKRAKQLGITEFINFKGFLPHKEMLQAINQSLIYLQANKTAQNGDIETFGLSIAEACALQCYVVCNNSGGVKDAITAYEKAWMFETGDIVGMAKKCIEIIENKKSAC